MVVSDPALASIAVTHSIDDHAIAADAASPRRVHGGRLPPHGDAEAERLWR